jgi:transposase-like protein
MQATQYGPCPEPASVWRSGPDKRSVGQLRSDSDEILGPHRFWGYLKRRLAAKGGIRRERLPLYLAECVWRYNHRKLSAQEQVRSLLNLL